MFFKGQKQFVADEEVEEVLNSVGWGQPLEIIDFCVVLLDSAAESPVQILKAVPSGEVVSLRQFSKETIWRLGSTGEILDTLSGWVDCLREDVENEGAVRLIELAIGSDNPALAHDVVQQQYLEGLEADYSVRVRKFLADFDKDSSSAEAWLYGDRLYERAEREYTLGYQYIERRIALNVIRGYREQEEFDSAEQLVDTAIVKLKKGMEKYQHGEGLLSMVYEQLVPEARYKYLAVLQNRKWLIQFLSN